MITQTFYGDIVGDREHTPRSKCTCILDSMCLEHSYPLYDPGEQVWFINAEPYAGWPGLGRVSTSNPAMSYRP